VLLSHINTNANLSITNATGSSPAAPSGLTKSFALNVVVVSSENISTNITLGYPCSVQSTVAPYKLKNDSWQQITPFNLNSSACTVSFTIPNDPIVGLFYKNIPNSASTTRATTSQLTTIPQKIMVSQRTYYIIIAIIVVAIIAITAGLYPGYRRRQRYGKIRYINKR
jgi:hypothetical protein